MGAIEAHTLRGDLFLSAQLFLNISVNAGFPISVYAGLPISVHRFFLISIRKIGIGVRRVVHIGIEHIRIGCCILSRTLLLCIESSDERATRTKCDATDHMHDHDSSLTMVQHPSTSPPIHDAQVLFNL